MSIRMDLLLFHDGKEKAITFSYDDGVTQDVRFLNMLNIRGLKGTFNINTGVHDRCHAHIKDGKTRAPDKLNISEVASIYEGHELAVHGLTHLDMTLVGSGTAVYEIVVDRANIEEIISMPVRGMAYPFGAYSEAVMNIAKSCGIDYSRTTNSTGNFELPKNFMSWHPTCHHADERLFEMAQQFFRPSEKYFGPKLFYIWGHSYEFDMRNDWDRMEQFLDYISGKDNVWYATNIQICDYLSAAKQLKYSASGKYIYNPTVHDIWIRLNPKSKDTIVLRAGETTTVQVQSDSYLM